MMYNNTRDVVGLVLAQLPRTIVEKITIDVQADAYFIRTTVVIVDAVGRRFETLCEPWDLEGVTVNVKLPEAFVAQLCVVV